MSVVALALVVPLTLTACGSDEEDSTEAAPSTETATKEAPSSKAKDEDKDKDAEKSSEAKDKDKDSEKSAQGKERSASNQDGNNAGGGDQAAAAESMVDPFEGGDPMQGQADIAPVEGGQAADGAVSGEINGLVRGLYDQQDMRSFMRYMPDHTCQRVLDAQPELRNADYNQIPQVSMDEASNGQWKDTFVQDIRDIKVKDNTASATVEVATPQGPDTTTMRFANEGGNWTFCN
ncbi:hypothetical protein [Corynebacterium sp. HMSC04H06]|uniref:hypothetical protein n=1 Tax=Corynebacterium sp. HMSC04H06 TaxID=1581050 RepID=UPI001FEF2FE0|nr:hypothetical protein [Corynebacterium sp. HMSC04H06]